METLERENGGAKTRVMTIIRWVVLPIAVIVGPIIVSAIFTVIYNLGAYLWAEPALGYPKEGEIFSVVTLMATLSRDFITGFSVPIIAYEIAPSLKKITTIVAATIGAGISVVGIALNTQQGEAFGWVSLGIMITMAGIAYGTYLVGKKEVYIPNNSINTLEKKQDSSPSLKHNAEKIAVEPAKTESWWEVEEAIDQWIRTKEDPEFVEQQIRTCYPEHAELAMKWYCFLTGRSFHDHTDKVGD